jgi:hypothetical protein
MTIFSAIVLYYSFVSIRKVKRRLLQTLCLKVRIKMLSQTTIRTAAVIGAGPSGLAAARRLKTTTTLLMWYVKI